MVKQEDKDKLKSLGFDVAEMETAFKSETESVLTIPTGSFFTDETILARDNNKIEEGKKAGIIEGKTAGFEIANKTIIEKYNLKDVTKKDETSKIIEALTLSQGKGDEGLQGQILALQKDKTDLEGRILTVEGEKKTFERNSNLMSMLPKTRLNTLNDAEYISLIQSSIEDVDGKMAIKLNGEILRNTQTRDIVPLQEGIAKLFESRNWLDTSKEGGRGGSDKTNVSTGIKTFSGATEQYVKDHGEGSDLSPEYRAYIVTLSKDTTFDMEK